MNNFSKILTGTLCTVVGVGAVGTACYYTIPSFRTKLNNILKDDNNLNVSIPSSPEEGSDNPDEVKPITPDEFKHIYKIALPNTFLGGDLYVKVLSNQNMIISSSIDTKILFYIADTEQTLERELDYSSWNVYCEIDDTTCLISSSKSNSGIYSLNISTGEVEKVYTQGNNFYFNKLKNNNYLINGTSGLLGYKVDIESFIEISKTSFSSRYELINGNYLLSRNASSSLYLLNYETFELSEINDFGFTSVIYTYPNGDLLFSSSGKGTYRFVVTDSSFVNISDVAYTNLKYLTTENDDIIFYSTSGLLILDSINNDLTIPCSDNIASCIPIKLNNGNYLMYKHDTSSGNIYYLNISTYSMNSIGSVINAEVLVLDTGDVFIYPNENVTMNRHYLNSYIFSIEDEELIKLSISSSSSYKHLSKVFKISNGNLLAVGSYSGVDYLYYIDILTKTDKLLYQTREGILDICEEEGVCIIYLNDIFDLEYNFETDTMSLIYIAESE